MATVDEAIAKIRSMRGGSVGSGQCYALAAYYAQLMGVTKFGLGGGVTAVHGNTGAAQNAQDIGQDFPWASEGWTVKGGGDIVVGSIVCIYGGDSTWQTVVPYGHVAIVTGRGNGMVEITDQNGFGGANTIGVSQHPESILSSAHIKSVIIPKGGAGSGAGLAPSAGAQGGQTASATFLEITSQFSVSPERYLVSNPFWLSYQTIQRMLTKYNIGWTDDFFNSDLVEFSLENGEGDKLFIKPELMEAHAEKPYLAEVLSVGSLGDFSNTKIFLDGYNQKFGEIPITNWGKKQIEDSGLPITWQNGMFYNVNHPNFTNSLTEENKHNLTIVNDSTASYMQSNKNQVAAQRATFNENYNMIKKQSKLRTKEADLSAKTSMLSADYAVDNAKMSSDFTTSDGLVGIAKGIGNLSLGSALSAGYDWYKGSKKNGRALDYAKDSRGLTKKKNKLNKQEVNLANMQAKLSQDQAVRAFNASLKDLEDTPDTIQQIGDEFGLYQNAGLFDIYLVVRFIPAPAVHRILKEIKLTGVTINATIDSDFNLLKNFDTFYKYFKMSRFAINRTAISKELLSSFEAIFITGTRVWNYSQVKNFDFIFDVNKIINTDYTVYTDHKMISTEEWKSKYMKGEILNAAMDSEVKTEKAITENMKTFNDRIKHDDKIDKDIENKIREWDKATGRDSNLMAFKRNLFKK